MHCHGETVTRTLRAEDQHEKGEERWIDFTSSIIDYHGKQCGLGTAFDVTNRKLAEQSLKESEERLRLLVGGSGL